MTYRNKTGIEVGSFMYTLFIPLSYSSLPRAHYYLSSLIWFFISNEDLLWKDSSLTSLKAYACLQALSLWSPLAQLKRHLIALFCSSLMVYHQRHLNGSACLITTLSRNKAFTIKPCIYLYRGIQTRVRTIRGAAHYLTPCWCPALPLSD